MLFSEVGFEMNSSVRSLDQVVIALGRLRPELSWEIQEARHPMFGQVIRLAIDEGEYIDFSTVGQQLTCMNWGLSEAGVERSNVHFVEELTSKSDAEVAQIISEFADSFSIVVRSDELTLVAKGLHQEHESLIRLGTFAPKFPNLVGVVGALFLGLVLVALSAIGAAAPDHPTNPVSGDFEVQTFQESEVIPLHTFAPNPGSGYVVVCKDGWISHSGGKQGACSHHGGVAD